jgi:deoxycytidylate deaminase
MLTDKDFLREAYKVAMTSQDPSTQNGAVLVKDGMIIARSCNRLLPGVPGTMADYSREEKYNLINHAEDGCVFHCASKGESTYGTTLYVIWYACKTCARAIAGAGIKRVVGHKLLLDGTPERWRVEVDAGLDILKRAGVQCDWLDGEFSDKDIFIRFDGKIITP